MDPDLSHKQWVSKVKERMPRHCSALDVVATPLAQIQSWPVSRRWWEAHEEEIRRWKEKTPHAKEDILQIVRRDLATVPPTFVPARFTTIVEGRPVQAQRLNLSTICNLMLLAWSLHFHAKVQTCRVTVHSVAAVAHPSLGQRLR